MKQLFEYTPATPPTGYVGFVQLFENPFGGFRIVTREHGGDGECAECPLPTHQAIALARVILAHIDEMEPT